MGRPQGVRPLRESVYLSTAEGDYTLFSERVLIGRGAHCRIIVLDPLVSREHAMLLITNSSVVLEDLRSANGVYVNNVRIFEPHQLFDGDRILVGTHEMAVFAPSTQPQPDPPVEPSSERRSAVQTVPSLRPGVSTDRSDAITILGHLADRMLAQELPGEAERVLADHLERLLVGVRSGLPVPPEICDSAARYALIFANELGKGYWLDYTLDLHLRAERLLAPDLVPLIIAAVSNCQDADPSMLAYYVEWVRTSAPRLGPEANRLFEALERAQRR